MPTFGANYSPDKIGTDRLSVALIGPDESKRQALLNALAEYQLADVREILSYPTKPDELQWLMEQSFDVVLLDLDSDPDCVLNLVERISANNTATVMVYSEMVDSKLAVRYMRAGAREYILLPLEQGVVKEVLDRYATIYRHKSSAAEILEDGTLGNLLVCLGAKGGSGVTTVACNLAIALAEESSQKTLLIDLALPIGDAALSLGIVADFSTEDAFRNADRLDARLLESMLVNHKSGLFVLAAPSQVPKIEASKNTIDRLIAVARRAFDHVIVDLGSRVDVMDTTLFSDASTVYLVTLTGVSELRNSNRLISEFFTAEHPKLEIVINRFEDRMMSEVSGDVVKKALGKPVRWKIPDDQEAAREMQYGKTGTARTRISRVSRVMASSITGHPVTVVRQEKKRGFGLKGFSRNTVDDISGNDTTSATVAPPVNVPPSFAPPVYERTTPTIAWPMPKQITYGEALTAAQLNATASVPGTFNYSPAPGEVLPAGTHTLSVTFTPTDIEKYNEANGQVPLNVAKAPPIIEWRNPRTIKHGTLLTTAQLNAKASVPGTFNYSPAPGEVLPAGTHTLSVTFTPTDCDNYTEANRTVSLGVSKATPSFGWSKPKPIKRGTPLTAAQLNATASLPGTFDYSPAPGEMLPSGTHALSVTFTPQDRTNYSPVQGTVSLTVMAKEVPAISWPDPGPITYGTPLTAEQLCAKASVPGNFDYLPPLAEMLAAGTHALSVTFTPADSTNYSTAQATVSLIVAKVTPSIDWPTPEPVMENTPLKTKQLCAKASVPGTFRYSPSTGEVLPAGTHTLSVTFTPKDNANYAIAAAEVLLTVTSKPIPAITWSSPEPTTFGTPLSARQLCATAEVPGTFDYSPAIGELLSAETHTLSVRFTPNDKANYSSATASVPLIVAKSVPNIEWSNPDPITYGAPLGASQLSATASIPGTFNYSPTLGEVLPAGTQTIVVIFTPTDGANYNTAKATVLLDVRRATPSIHWPIPGSIQHGTPLGAKQLCATASVSGSFDYNSAVGKVLPAGRHTLSVIFAPVDSSNYTAAESTTSLEVTPATPTIEWPSPDSITFGMPLSTKQLCATAPIPGTFDYSPALEALLPAGAHTLSVAFTPTDSANYAKTQATVLLEVAKVTSTIRWPNPDPISYGTPLSSKQLCATASVPGTFDYSPAPGELMPAGPHMLSVIFTPADSTNHTAAKTTVLLEVARVTPTIEWPSPDPITYGVPLSSKQLRATSPVPGTFDYSPALGALLPAGSHALSLIFTPADSANYTSAMSSASLDVVRATPTIECPKDSRITYGTLLSTKQLGATASVPGTFEYSPAVSEALATGSHRLSITFIPNDSANYTTAHTTVSLEVVAAMPAIEWPNPDPITFGIPLSSTQLCATASVPGTLHYVPALDELLPAGAHTLSVTFTPADSVNYSKAQATVLLEVAKVMSTILWPNPEPITCDTPLSGKELCATASVPGRLEYSSVHGELLPAGAHSLSVIFTPADSTNYTSAKSTVLLEVVKVMPTITWPSTDPITFGTPLSTKQLCATASVPGTFDYAPAFDEVLAAGSHTLSLVFTPTDCVNYTVPTATVSLTVVKATPTIQWPKPGPITCDTLLGIQQLCATASVPGAFDYSPAPDRTVAAGTQTLSVIFTPADKANYNSAEATVPIEVAMVTPSIEWSIPRPIKCGTALGPAQLCAAAWVPGTFEYSPAAGELLPLGTHTLSVTFIPTNGENYATTQATVSLEVAKAEPSIEWPTPKPISYGTALGAAQLCATSSVPGTLVYSPAAGKLLPNGTHTLSVTFTPKDITSYATAKATVLLDVAKAAPTITWPKPIPITFGTPLGSAQLCAMASIPGKFSYLPAPGEFLPRGMHTLSVTFTPDDSEHYATAMATVSLNVNKATPLITWPDPEPIAYGTPLSTSELCATASLPGTFDYSPALGKVLPAGTHTLAATFTPSDSEQCATAQTTVVLKVKKPRDLRIVAALSACLALILLFYLRPQIISGTKSAVKQAITRLSSGQLQPAVPAAQPEPVTISPNVATRLLIHKTKPIYPQSAKSAGVSGTVEMSAIISETGTIKDLQVLSGPAELQQAAVDAVRNWHYKPYKLDNKPTEVKTTIKVTFSLGG